MKKNLNWILIAVTLVAVLVTATVLYNKYSKELSGDNLADNSQSQSGSGESDDYSAPDFTVLDERGNKVKLSAYKGKPVVLNFWATWCYYCKEEMPDFNTAYEKYPDVQFMMINATDGVQETMSSAQEYVKNQGFDFDVFYDTELEAVNAYYVSSFPTTFFIDKDGNLVTYANGMLDLETLEKGIEMINK